MLFSHNSSILYPLPPLGMVRSAMKWHYFLTKIARPRGLEIVDISNIGPLVFGSLVSFLAALLGYLNVSIRAINVLLKFETVAQYRTVILEINFLFSLRLLFHFEDSQEAEILAECWTNLVPGVLILLLNSRTFHILDTTNLDCM